MKRGRDNEDGDKLTLYEMTLIEGKTVPLHEIPVFIVLAYRNGQYR